ncbi:serine threonine-protein kinase [Ophiostoma piceae UAMH 11346]|uniref:non-specific serine/threonine protein kinase n=1 Tax=Ophiostoma piceae (strain UAMH 11346) TaxID=1262450 RepID=S3CU52_OPHP1|nr:serine threonine-protein kinase [Ophiostoma piceae UAMH 11346]
MADVDEAQPAAAAVDSKILDGITSWRGFTDLTQIFERKGRDKATSKFSCTLYTLIDTEDNATIYFGQVDAPKREVSLERAKQSLARIPDDALYPVLPAELQANATEQLPPPDTQYYLKRPKILNYRHAVGTTDLADHLLEEALTLDLLRRNPHPNVGVCDGYWVPPGKHGRMAGIILRRYSMTLHDYIGLQKSGSDSEDPAAAAAAAAVRAAKYMQELTAAADHLHSLGVAHNDINPRNIMLDENDSIVLVDLGSCKPLGEELTEFGTPPFNEGFDEVSAKKNDEIGLQQIQAWLGLAAAQ